jgi:photosystem II stability/assembly factor-like uncharacterized protein
MEPTALVVGRKQLLNFKSVNMTFKPLTNQTSRVMIVLLSLLLSFSSSFAERTKKDKDKEKDEKRAITDTIRQCDIAGLGFRSIGPALTSGRIADFAVNPANHSEYYVAVASGHIWKTINNGNTFQPVFDDYGAYSIGCIEMDPKDSHVLWAGTGENNHQRSLGYGDGVYKTIDGGKSWTNMGLKESRQIGMIAIHPDNSDIVFVAAEGSVWGPGGDRGLYRTTDGGKTWEKVLNISENTGVNNVLIHPKNHNIMFATSEQRRRHDYTKISGGPETAIYKSTDSGKTWNKLTAGLPGGDMGGIGIDISPVDTDVIYAIIEAQGGESGFYRSSDCGETWAKMSDHSAQGQYYNEIYCDPKDVNKVYSMETVSAVTLDGGRTWNSIGNNSRHVDDHAFWIEPQNTDHFLIGGDGGVYETFDAGQNFFFKTNLPVTQFYRVNTDNSEPFYWVYGGTQDNNSIGGPSRNTCYNGVSTYEWVVTLGGDGFWQAIDPTDPNIVYSAYQYGNIYRFDKKSGERLKIRPEPLKGEETYKWNWNTPFILSPHSHTRLYIAANKVFRSDDRGQSWQVISGDITTQTDRNTWPVMDHDWSVDAVGKDVSTSLYGCAVTLAESPLVDGLLFVGTDDGVIQVTEDAGKNWTRNMKFPGVPEYTYVSDVVPDRFDANVVYACFDNIRRDDFHPYLLKSSDKGKTWNSIAGNLPQNYTVLSIAQDFKDPNLIFVGTEFGAFFTTDGGKIWNQLKTGLPTIKVYDIAIQERECDLVLATFGRGFYILDNYAPLRELSKQTREKDAYIFPVKDALMYTQTGGLYGQGSNFFYAPNPEFGATFTYYLKDVPKTLKQTRTEKERDLFKDKKHIPIPTTEELKAEKDEIPPYLLFTIKDPAGNVVRKISSGASIGTSRVSWDLCYANKYSVNLDNGVFNPNSTGGSGFLALPGKYTVTMSLVFHEVEKLLAGPIEFNVKALNNTTLPAENRQELVAFQEKVASLINAVNGADEYSKDLMKQVQYIKQAIQDTPGAPQTLIAEADKTEKKLHAIMWDINGETPKASEEENLPAPPSIMHRLGSIMEACFENTSTPTGTQHEQYALLEEELPPILAQLKEIDEKDVKSMKDQLDQLGAPWTPGRVPEWKK